LIVLKSVLALNRTFWDDNVESRRKRWKVYYCDSCRDDDIYPSSVKSISQELLLWENKAYSALPINVYLGIVYLPFEEIALIDFFKEFFSDGLIKTMCDIINEYAR